MKEKSIEGVFVVFFGLAASVVEQAAAVRTHSDLQVGEYSDSEKTTTWTDQHWSREIAENQVAARALRGLLSSMTVMPVNGAVEIAAKCNSTRMLGKQVTLNLKRFCPYGGAQRAAAHELPPNRVRMCL